MSDYLYRLFEINIKFLFVWFILLITSVNADSSGESGVMGDIQDIADRELKELNNVKDIIQNTQKEVDEEVNTNLAVRISKLNSSLRDATVKIQNSTREYQQTYNKAAANKLLQEMSEAYGQVLDNFDKIPLDFLFKAKMMYENSVVKGGNIARNAIDRNIKDLEYKSRLINDRKYKYRMLANKIKNGNRSSENIAQLKRMDVDIRRLTKLQTRQQRAMERWRSIDKNFDKIGRQLNSKMASVETSIIAFNQLQDELKDQKKAIDHMLLVAEIDSITSTEFENSVDSIMTISDDLASATDLAFNDVFVGILGESEKDTDSKKQSQESNNGNISDAELEKLLNQY